MRPPAPARPLAAIGAQHHPPGGRFLAWSSVDHGCPHRVMVCRLLACLCWRRMGSEATVVDVDAMVAGGGPNGLAAAVRLAEAGWSVCLVEANQDIGGSARTLECTLPGFRHDLGAGFLALAMVSPATAGRDLARFGLRFCHAPLPAAHPLPGGRAIALGRSTMQTAASIGRIHAADAAVWEQLDGTSAMGSSGWCTPGWSAGPEPPRCGRVTVGAETRSHLDLGLASWVALSAEPVVLVGSGLLSRNWLASLPRGAGHGVDLVVVDRLTLHPDLMPLPALGLGHHLGHQVAAQPHLPRLSPTGPRATLRGTRCLVHKRLAHALASRKRVLGSWSG